MATAYRDLKNWNIGDAPISLTGQAAGDLMYGGVISSAAITADANWTTLSNTQDGNTGKYQYFAWRKADGSANDAFAPTSAGGGAVVKWGFSGPDATTPHEQFGLTPWAGTAATVFPPNATPSSNNSIHNIVYVEQSGPQSLTTPPAGYTNIYTGSGFWIYYKQLSGGAGVAIGPINAVFGGNVYGPVWDSIVNAGGGGGGGGTKTFKLALGLF